MCQLTLLNPHLLHPQRWLWPREGEVVKRLTQKQLRVEREARELAYKIVEKRMAYSLGINLQGCKGTYGYTWNDQGCNAFAAALTFKANSFR